MGILARSQSSQHSIHLNLASKNRKIFEENAQMNLAANVRGLEMTSSENAFN